MCPIISGPIQVKCRLFEINMTYFFERISRNFSNEISELN